MARELLSLDPHLWLSVSATTRQPREGEVDGRDYLFVDRERFEHLDASEGFLERFEVFGELYGTPRGPVVERLDEGSDVLLEIDVQGAFRVRAACPSALLVFLAVPSREEQRQRLLDRGGLSWAQVEGRLAGAEGEEAMAGLFDRIVVNDELKRAVSEVAGILTERRRL